MGRVPGGGAVCQGFWKGRDRRGGPTTLTTGLYLYQTLSKCALNRKLMNVNKELIFQMSSIKTWGGLKLVHGWCWRLNWLHTAQTSRIWNASKINLFVAYLWSTLGGSREQSKEMRSQSQKIGEWRDGAEGKQLKEQLWEKRTEQFWDCTWAGNSGPMRCCHPLPKCLLSDNCTFIHHMLTP